jgi:LysR family glycine cleavage system transcriptional activator
MHLPPINALRTFEAAARHGSFKKAAEVLHMTPSAVSHQIKSLEELLGVALFRRATRKVHLTDRGRAYLPPVREALDLLREATERVTAKPDKAVLNISAAPSFAVGWLMPRLSAFQVAHPEIETRLNASIEMVDFADSDIDLAIRHTAKVDTPGLAAHRLMEEELIPVASPQLLERQPLETPNDLAKVQLIHSVPRMGRWRSWLRAMGADKVDAESGPKFDHDAMAVQAALSGMGVAIVNRGLVAKQLGDGTLVAPFPHDLHSDLAFWLVYPRTRGDDPAIRAFRDWLFEQVGQTAAGPDALQDG